MILLDTHAALWFAMDNGLLGKRSQRTIDRALEDDQLAVSVISFWEITLLIAKRRVAPSILQRKLAISYCVPASANCRSPAKSPFLPANSTACMASSRPFIAATAIRHVACSSPLMKTAPRRHSLRRQNAKL